MSKRGPTSELNHDNWDQEDDAKDSAGEFKQAATDELKKRVILQAKRKSCPAGADDAPKTPFGNFTAFGNKAATPKADFSFLANKSTPSSITKTPAAKTNGNSTPKPDDKQASKEYYHQLKSLNVSVSAWIAKHVQTNPYCILTPVFRDYEKHLAKIEQNRPPQLDSESTDSSTTIEPPQIVQSNTNEAEKTSVPSPPSPKAASKSKDSDSDESENSPLIPLVMSSNSETSIKLASPTASKPEEEAPRTESVVPSPATTPAASIFGSFGSAASFSFGSAKPSAAASPNFMFGTAPNAAPTSLFSNTSSGPFGANPTASAQFGFGGFGAKPATTTSTGSLFGNTGTGTFSFGNFAKPAETSEGGNHEESEESEEPPKVEFKAIEEDDTIYSTKCKMFVNKDKEYKERGLGQLYIKRKDAESKAQLLIRSSSATGQILLNVLVSGLMKIQLKGSNNVEMACIVTPGDASPTVVMIRVKTNDDAKTLLAKIEENKK